MRACPNLAAWAAAFCMAGILHAASISGTITNPDRCAGVSAIRRGGSVTRLRIHEFKGRFDPQTGSFTIRGLEEDKYNLRVHLKGGGYLDGALMALPEDEASERKMTDEDRQQIKDFIANYPERFVDIIRPLRIEGNGDFARVLVEKIRHRDYHSGKKGDIVWRMEVWKFEELTGEWVRSQHGWFVLARERISDTGRHSMTHDKFRGLRWVFTPELAGFEIVGDKSITGVRYTIPEKIDMSMGKVPGSVAKQIKEDRERLKKKQEIEGLE